MKKVKHILSSVNEKLAAPRFTACVTVALIILTALSIVRIILCYYPTAKTR